MARIQIQAGAPNSAPAPLGFRREGCTCFIVNGGVFYSLCENHEAERKVSPHQFGAGLDGGKWIIDREIK